MKRPSLDMSADEATDTALPIYDLGDVIHAVEQAAHFTQVRIPCSRIHGPRIIAFTSRKAQEHAEHYARFILEGRPEGYAALRFEFDPLIKHYGPQPFVLRFFDNTTIAHYTADFLVFYADGRVALVEVKPRLSFAQPRVKTRLALVEDSCRAAGIDFIRLTAEELEQQPRLDNLLFFYAYLALPATQLDSLIDILYRAARPLPRDHILRLNPLITPADIAAGLATGHLFASHRFRWGPQFNLSLGVNR